MDYCSAKMAPSRQEYLLNELKNKYTIRISDICSVLQVSEMTIRRDIIQLEKEGKLKRVHGGAVALENNSLQEVLYEQKSCENKEAKDYIAKFAATLVKADETIFINSGSTVLRLFNLINVKNVKIITNNAFFPLKSISDNLEIISCGGLLRKESFSLIGNSAIDNIKEIYADKAFIGIDGVDINRGLTNSVREESQINKTMIEQTNGEVYVLADSTKIGKMSSFFVSNFEKITAIITDKKLSKNIAKQFTDSNIKLYLV